MYCTRLCYTHVFLCSLRLWHTYNFWMMKAAKTWWLTLPSQKRKSAGSHCWWEHYVMSCRPNVKGTSTNAGKVAILFLNWLFSLFSWKLFLHEFRCITKCVIHNRKAIPVCIAYSWYAFFAIFPKIRAQFSSFIHHFVIERNSYLVHWNYVASNIWHVTSLNIILLDSICAFDLDACLIFFVASPES